MRNILLTILLLSSFFVFTHEIYHNSEVIQGHPITFVISPVTDSFDYTFIIYNSSKKEILKFQGFYYYLEEIHTPVILGLAGIPSNLPPGKYIITAQGLGRFDTYFFERAFTVVDGEYSRVELIANSKMDHIINGEKEPDREAQSQRLWEAISSFSKYSLYEEYTLTQPIQGRHTSPFGFERVTKYPKGKDSISVHKGEDIANKRGTTIFSDGRGVVILAENRIVTGNTVVVEHLPGVKTLYYHMDSIYVKKGDIVLKGDKIGEVGSTGFSTGPHLHWELRISTVPVNPMLFIDTPLIDKKDILNMINTTNNKRGG